MTTTISYPQAMSPSSNCCLLVLFLLLPRAACPPGQLVPLDNENKRYEGGCEFVSSSTASGKDGKPL